MARTAERQVEIGGHVIKRGAIVAVNIFGIHRREKYFADPDRFDPTRFQPAQEKLLPRHAFMPFGGGPRICIGNHFALMEGHLTLAALGQRDRLELTSSSEVLPEPLITLRPKGGIRMRDHRRASAAVISAGGVEGARGYPLIRSSLAGGVTARDRPQLHCRRLVI